MTKWPLESLRVPRDAIMTVGYDASELLILSTGRSVFERSFQYQHPHASKHNYYVSRVLDLCCCCGIQGIYAAIIATTKFPKSIDINDSLELESMGINKRARHFVVANACINDLASGIHYNEQRTKIMFMNL